MTQATNIKQGDTFAPVCHYFADDGVTAASLVGVTIKSQMRDAQGKLIKTFTPTITNAAAGEFSLDAWDNSTNLLGSYYLDLAYTAGGNITHTETVAFNLVKTITQTP